MAKAPSTQKPQRPTLTADQKRQVILRLKRRISELKTFDPNAIPRRFHSPELDALEASIDETLVAAFGKGTTEYNRYHRAA